MQESWWNGKDDSVYPGFCKDTSARSFELKSLKYGVKIATIPLCGLWLILMCFLAPAWVQGQQMLLLPPV